MKKIICFGDSNTFGFNPKNGSRFDKNTRWTGLLATQLGVEFEIIEEGCNNRTGFFISPDGLLQSGFKYLPECLHKNQPFDIFILALGTNDLQKFFRINEKIAEEGLLNLIKTVKSLNPNARIIVIPPVILGEDVLKSHFCCQFDERSIAASRWIQEIYESTVKIKNCELLDLNKFVKPSVLDGLHFDEDSHKKIAEKLAELILKEDSAGKSVASNNTFAVK